MDSAGVDTRRAAIAPGPWTWLRQVHGSRVVVVTRPGEHAGEEADAAVTATPGCVLAVQVADCAPIALVAASTVDGASSVIGVAHGGWRGILGGIVPATVGAMRDLGAGAITATVGPCIHAECYEFGASDLEAFPPAVRTTTMDGRPALDVPAAVVLSLHDAGVTDVEVSPVCTSCSPQHWSFRRSGDVERQAVVAWM